jgi:hypothetical protein
MKTDNQAKDILHHIELHGSITPLEALQLYGCFRLGARIWDLRSQGHNIINEWEENNGKRYAKYVLARKPEQMECFV